MGPSGVGPVRFTAILAEEMRFVPGAMGAMGARGNDLIAAGTSGRMPA